MKIEGEHTFNGPRNEVWEMIRDPEILASALPGTQKLNKLSDTDYEGTMNVRVGPVSGSFSGKLVVSDEVPPQSCTLTVDGKGAPGFVRGVGHIKFEEQETNTTYMTYEGEVTIGGTLASVGQRMIDSVAKSMIRQGFESMDKALEARLANKSGQQVEYKPPTETEFAASVAKDVAKSWYQIAEVRMVMYVIPAAILLALIGYILSQLLHR
ncbi:MAG TPA: carbon monoxide dehydrogenase subunit G [Anaerolineaceae bacterium]|nr:carbon monoxide dehydrogenase subunit G [Anaerolineaceae bacterium]